MVWRCCVVVMSLLGCGACASVISDDVRRTVNPQVSFAQIAADPAGYTGTLALLAGTIIEATNLREGTRLAILQYPTGSRDRPLTDRLSGGRSLLLAPGYLETAVYRPGRAITVVGEVRGQQVLPLDDTTYRYPLLVPRELYLWREGYDIPRFHIGFGLGFSTGF